MSWLQKIADVFPEGSDVRVYTKPHGHPNKAVVYAPHFRRGKNKGYLRDKKRYLIEIDGKDEEVHPKNLARPY